MSSARIMAMGYALSSSSQLRTRRAAFSGSSVTIFATRRCSTGVLRSCSCAAALASSCGFDLALDLLDAS